MYLFWDNSNIHYSGLNTVYPMIEPGKERGIYRTYFKKLFELARKGRIVEGAYAAGSIPPPSDELWTYLEGLGIDITLLDKTADDCRTTIHLGEGGTKKEDERRRQIGYC